LMGEYHTAINLLNEGKSYFLEDGREAECQWSRIWLIAAYEQASLREQARLEFNDLIVSKDKPNHTLLIAMYQASLWLTPLQNDPVIGKALNSLLERARQLGEQMPATRRALRRLAFSIEMPSANLKIRAFGRTEVVANGRAVNISDWRTQS